MLSVSQNRLFNKARNRHYALRLGLIACMGVSILLTGCVKWPQPSSVTSEVKIKSEQPIRVPQNAVPVFFSKYQGNHSVVDYVVRELPQKEKTEPLAYAVEALLKGPTAEEKANGFYTEIPAGTHLNKLTRNEQTITLDLSPEFTTGGGSTSMTQRLEQMKQTVKAQDAAHPLKITVEGKPLETLGGEGLEVPATLESKPQ